ncbi:MAG: ABC transporter ATP-binding protein [Candidatus Delongbacteria bacterium]|jgi:lipoprotein-releasing system ATP-binding protein|nr:ABC transporter ATP-binding protein [Candidatus Delongbacteria bacterium]
MLLKVKDLYKNYQLSKREIPVLKGVNLELKQGEIIAIMGKSGAGKSTLLNIIGTLDKPQKGIIEFKGEDILKYSEKQLANFRNKNIGFVFQFHYLLPEFTALENIMLPGLIRGENMSELRDRAKKLLDLIELSDRAEHRSGELSGGEQQRIAFARALINKPSLILADEPSGNLDNTSSDKLHDIMWSFAKENNTSFIVVTHDKALAEKADRTINIIDGVI